MLSTHRVLTKITILLLNTKLWGTILDIQQTIGDTNIQHIDCYFTSNDDVINSPEDFTVGYRYA